MKFICHKNVDICIAQNPKEPPMPDKSKIKWGGFVNDKLDITKDIYNGYSIYAIFPNRKTARLCYQDVRPVRIEEISNAR